MYSTPMMFPDGRVMVFNPQFNQWVEVRPLAPVVPQQQELFQARATSQPPVSAGSYISESVAEEVLAQPSEPELAELPTKARASCPVAEEEEEVIMSAPDMTFLSSQDQYQQEAESESGTASVVDLSTGEYKEETLTPTPSTIDVRKYLVARRVQVRAGPTAKSENVCILTPGERVQVVETQTSRTKTGFVTTKAYVLSKEGQGWVSLNRQHKKTDETFVFKGQASAGFRRLIKLDDVWRLHEATVKEVSNASARTFTVRVTCPTFQQMEALRSDLKTSRLQGRVLINKKIPQLINLKREFGNARPSVHVFDLDTDLENSHEEFLQAFDWSNQYRGSTKDFEHQVVADLQNLRFGGIRRVSWAAGRTSTGRFSIRDFCMVEFTNDSHLRNFLKNYQKYDFFRGARAKVDPIYENLATIPASSANL